MGTTSRIGQVNDTLFVGGDPIFSDDLAADIATVAACDIVLDLREETGDDGWDTYTDAPVFHRIGMYDDGKHKNSSALFHQALDIIVQHAQHQGMAETDVKVYVHCHMGVNRAPSMAMFLLLALNDYEVLDSFTAVREARPVAQVAYAQDAIRAWLDLYDGDDDDHVLFMWRDYERLYWLEHRSTQRAINKWIRARHKQGYVYTDGLGRMHATAG